MSKFIVYCTTCIVNNKIYVGVHQTSDPSKFDGYIGCGVIITQPSTYEHSKTVFQKAVKKYGCKNFKRKTIAIFDNEEDAYALEAEIVNEQFVSRPDVYNMVPGGLGGDRGIQSKQCYQYDKDGKYLRGFSSQQEASRFVNRGYTTIKRAVHDKMPAAGFYWAEYKVDKLDLSSFKQGNNRIPIYQYSSDGRYCCCYESISDAARCNNTSAGQIKEAAEIGTMIHDSHFSYEFADRYSFANKKELYQKPVYIYDIYGNYLRESKNLVTLKKELKSKKDLYKYVKLNNVFDKKYQFSFEKLPKMKDKSVKKQSKRKVAQYDLEGNLVKVYNTIAECARIYGTGVKHCLRGRNKQSKGFCYKYIE